MDVQGIPTNQIADAMVLDPAALDGLHIRLRAGKPESQSAARTERN